MLITMKKYIPIFIAIFILSFYLVSQGVFNTGDPTANIPSDQKKIHKHYETEVRDLKLKDMDGKAIKVDFTKNVVIINFWASWCTPCLQEFPSLVEAYGRFKDKGLVVIGINTDEKDQGSSAKKIVEKYALNFPNHLDKSGGLINKFFIESIPISIIFHNGKVVEVSKEPKDFSSEEFSEKLNKWLN